MRLASLGLRSLIAAAASLIAMAALDLLWGQRPALPELPSSLSAPVTTALLQQLVLVAAWLLSALVILLLLVWSLRALVARRSRQPPQTLRAGAVLSPRHRSLAQARLTADPGYPAFPPPFPLIPRGHSEPRRDFGRAPMPVWEPALAVAAPALGADPATARLRAGPSYEFPPPSIALLGPPKIAGTKRRRRGLRSQTLEFLAYLALHAEGVSTDEVVVTLWPDVDTGKARKRLWRSVSDARSHLGETILRVSDRYLLDRQVVAVDLDLFDELLARADAERDLNREQFLERALALVRGEPLAGVDYPWAVGDVRHLRARVVGLLEELGHHRLSYGNPTGALAAAEQAIALDAYNEAVHQLAMRAEAVLGLRQAIAERYERLCQELDTRFGLEPERETRLLYRRLLGQDARRSSTVNELYSS